ncbi:MAG: hypothetical protein N4A57_05080, partial [Anaeromicrobium sp.]|uniref:hypothetical protein n=1 Tax=Anaeromicrobium sp. TaxID=1929132 RepID=UPI0025ED71FA
IWAFSFVLYLVGKPKYYSNKGVFYFLLTAGSFFEPPAQQVVFTYTKKIASRNLLKLSFLNS